MNDSELKTITFPDPQNPGQTLTRTVRITKTPTPPTTVTLQITKDPSPPTTITVEITPVPAPPTQTIELRFLTDLDHHEPGGDDAERLLTEDVEQPR